MKRVICILALFVSMQLEAALTFVNDAPTGLGPLFVAYSHHGNFAAVANSVDGTVSQYTVDCETGALTNIATAISEFSPLYLSFEPCDQHAVVANYDNGGEPGTGSVTLYEINCDTGEWSLVQKINDPTQVNQPRSIAYSPDGRFVAVANAGVNAPFISIFRVSPISGKLIFVEAVPDVNANIVAFSPDGKHLAVSHFAPPLSLSRVTVYNVNPTTGSLTLIQDLPTGSNENSFGITYQHNGKFVAVTELNADQVVIFSVDQTTGLFSLLPVQTITTADGLGNGPSYIAFTQDDGLAIVGVSTNPGDVAVFQVCDGVWQLPAIQILPDLQVPAGVAISCSDFAAVTNANSGSVTAYQITEPTCP